MGDLPAGAGYVTAAYAIAAALYVGYWLRLRKLAKKNSREWKVGSGRN
ncbi:MAG TPA: hypothetical protein VFS94_09035 [Gemmatimonadales bacterium]|nr:hypothetical protein [Gemmatimonadales bacterium]